MNAAKLIAGMSTLALFAVPAAAAPPSSAPASANPAVAPATSATPAAAATPADPAADAAADAAHRGRRRLFGAVAVAAVFFAVLSATAGWFWRQSTVQRARAETSAKVAQTVIKYSTHLGVL